jgi:hypothetical protein
MHEECDIRNFIYQDSIIREAKYIEVTHYKKREDSITMGNRLWGSEVDSTILEDYAQWWVLLLNICVGIGIKNIKWLYVSGTDIC